MPHCTKFMMLDEVLAALKDLRRRAKRGPSNKLNLTVFRLACCCGLRRSEIAGLLLILLRRIDIA